MAQKQLLLLLMSICAFANAVERKSSITSGSYASALTHLAESGDADALDKLEKQDPEKAQEIFEKLNPSDDVKLVHAATSLKPEKRAEAIEELLKRKEKGDEELWEDFQAHEAESIRGLSDLLSTIRVCANGLQAWTTDWKERVTIINLTPDTVKGGIHGLLAAKVPLPPAFFFLLEQLNALSKVLSYHLAFILASPDYWDLQKDNMQTAQMLSAIQTNLRKLRTFQSKDKQEEKYYNQLLSTNPKPGQAYGWLSDISYEVLPDGTPTNNSHLVDWPSTIKVYNFSKNLWIAEGKDWNGKKLTPEALEKAFPDLLVRGRKLRQMLSGGKLSKFKLANKYRNSLDSEGKAELDKMVDPKTLNLIPGSASGEITFDNDASFLEFMESFLEVSEGGNITNPMLDIEQALAKMEKKASTPLMNVEGVKLGNATLRAMENLTLMLAAGQPLLQPAGAIKYWRTYQESAQAAYSSVLNFREMLHATGSGHSDLMDRQAATLDNMKCVEGEVEHMQEGGFAFLPSELHTIANQGVMARTVWRKFAEVFDEDKTGYKAYGKLLAFITNYLAAVQVSVGAYYTPIMPFIQPDVVDDFVHGEYKEDITAFYKFYNPMQYAPKAFPFGANASAMRK